MPCVGMKPDTALAREIFDAITEGRLTFMRTLRAVDGRSAARSALPVGGICPRHILT